MNANIIIECKDLGKQYKTPEGERVIIERMDLAVKENEFVVLFGPGQCGKTTMIRLLSGLEQPDRGAVRINGKRIQGRVRTEELYIRRFPCSPG